jgi:predicted component of type VI protein secretion system
MVVTGAAIGFFIGLVETLMKQAWIRVVQGRNEGKEYVISKPRTTIGRDELSDIGLYGDRNISPLHAVIELQGGRHVLTDAGTPIGLVVNGQRMATHVLRDGDVIEVASMRLEFHEKATASRIAAPVDQTKPAVKIPSMDGICPFCGTKKDPKTGACACSVGSTPIAQPPMTPMPPSSPSPSQWQNPSTVAMQVSAPGGGPRLVAISGPHSGQVFPLGASTM